MTSITTRFVRRNMFVPVGGLFAARTVTLKFWECETCGALLADEQAQQLHADFHGRAQR